MTTFISCAHHAAQLKNWTFKYLGSRA